MDIKVIGVLGAGTMGNGVAQLAAQAGYQVVMRDIEDRFVENGLKAIEKFLTKSVEKGKMTEDQKKGCHRENQRDDPNGRFEGCGLCHRSGFRRPRFKEEYFQTTG